VVKHVKIFFVVLLTTYCGICSAQMPSADQFKPDPAKEQMYFPYLAARHGGPAATQEWKNTNKVQYYQELWYYSESFYVKRNYNTSGVDLDASIIDISRFESARLKDREAIVQLPGFRDVLVLLPETNLKYKP
jgi:hypothetical protein